MTSRERVLRTIKRQTVDRLPVNYLGTPEIDARLKEHFNVKTNNEFLDILGVDIRVIAPQYVGPDLSIAEEYCIKDEFGIIRKRVKNEAGVYYEPVNLPWKCLETVEEVDALDWPNLGMYDFSTIKAQCEQFKDKCIVYGRPGLPGTINSIAFGRGVEQVMMDIALREPVYLALKNKRFQICFDIAKRVLEKADGKIDILWIGNDLGSQRGLLISPQDFNELYAPEIRAFCDLAHRHGAYCMMHSCGSTHVIFPNLIELGLDIYDTVQPEADGMDPAILKERFGGQLCFHGTISTQKTLPFGTVDDVEKEVKNRMELFSDGGCIIAPSHNIQPDTPLKNILKIYETVGSLKN